MMMMIMMSPPFTTKEGHTRFRPGHSTSTLLLLGRYIRSDDTLSLSGESKPRLSKRPSTAEQPLTGRRSRDQGSDGELEMALREVGIAADEPPGEQCSEGRLRDELFIEAHPSPCFS
jgi:hypothetical protein